MSATKDLAERAGLLDTEPRDDPTPAEMECEARRLIDGAVSSISDAVLELDRATARLVTIAHPASDMVALAAAALSGERARLCRYDWTNKKQGD